MSDNLEPRLERAVLLGSVSFVVPAHNEQECIEEVLAQAIAAIDGVEFGGEVIIVDDASDDATGELVRKAAENDGRIRLIRSEENVGAQRCIMRGLLESKGDVGLVIPADLQVVAADIMECLPALDRADLVCTKRTPRAEGFHRRVMSSCFNWIVSRAIGLPFSDLDSSFLIRRRVIDDVIPSLAAHGDFLQAEMVARVVAAGDRVVEVPIRHYRRPAGKPTALTPKMVIRTFVDLAHLFGYLRRLLRGADTAS